MCAFLFHLPNCMAVSVLVSLSACAAQSGGNALSWYGNHDGIAPRAERIYICHGFGCAYKTPVSYTGSDLRRLRSILSSGRGSAQAERRAISRAVQWQERRVASAAGSSSDIGGLDLHNAGTRGQMDCIDEATNTTSLLLLAQRHGFLRHHTVSSPVARGFFLDGRYPHATATVRDKRSGVVFAVDSWPRANGEPPVIADLSIWFSRRAP
ncbi:hypothetical protein E1297_14840 [Roseibium sp. RKSG952]|nr:hypothetical protein [Roseibium sp. RKSG952]